MKKSRSRTIGRDLEANNRRRSYGRGAMLTTVRPQPSIRIFCTTTAYLSTIYYDNYIGAACVGKRQRSKCTKNTVLIPFDCG